MSDDLVADMLMHANERMLEIMSGDVTADCPDCKRPNDACECEPYTPYLGLPLVAPYNPNLHAAVARKAEPLIPVGQGWSDPPAEVLTDPGFEAIWEVIKTWDINVPSAYGGYCGATGNHVYAIYRAMAAVAPKRLPKGFGAGEMAKIKARMEEREISPWLHIEDVPRPKVDPNAGLIRATNQEWHAAWSATEWQRQQAVALVEERDREIVQLRAERAAWKYLFETANPDARMVAADEGSNREYHGPVKDGKAIPDPVHERVHEVIGDVLGGNVMRPARDQLEKALSDARVKDGKAPPPFPSITKPTDHRRLGL